ncbi:hypothetical protein ACHIPZ_24915 [Antrihabitans sp. NCIMB 15449]|uniref:Uncharacterized protein n=1 Tax=Antrihabitans spumae TaxID=3373370 RepID=A0ABW7JU74_9NOCA
MTRTSAAKNSLSAAFSIRGAGAPQLKNHLSRFRVVGEIWIFGEGSNTDNRWTAVASESHEVRQSIRRVYLFAADPTMVRSEQVAPRLIVSFGLLVKFFFGSRI